MSDNEYYNGTKILNMRDLDGERPEIYMVTSNRNAGKTTYFSRYFLNRYFDYGEKFILLYRFSYEMSNAGANFFAGQKQLFFPEYEMTSKPRVKGKYHELLIKREDNDHEKPRTAGYAIALNDSEIIRKLSPMFSDCKRILFDEFQSETNHYCDSEIIKFRSIHTSLARGGGKQVKYMPVFMLSNYTTLLNPYFTAMNIGSRLNADTKFLRGHGFVLEQNINAAASKSLKSSRFNSAFSDTTYLDYAAENVYLRDNTSFISKMNGNARYYATIRYDGRDYAIREYDNGVYYCGINVDNSFRLKIAVTPQDHAINYQILPMADFIRINLRHAFMTGNFRFYDLACKEALMKLASF